MKNQSVLLCSKRMLPLLFGISFFVSCQKDDSAIDEYRYRRNLSLRRTTSSILAPIMRAGVDQKVSVSSVTLDGSTSTGATTYAWTQEVGPEATIASPDKATTKVTGLKKGEYRFKLVGTNTSGTGSDTIHVSVTSVTGTSGTSSGSAGTGTSTPSGSGTSTGGSSTGSGSTGSGSTGSGSTGSGSEPAESRGNLLSEATFEGSKPFSSFYELSAASCCSFSIAQSSNFARTGSSSVKFTLNSNDPVVGYGTRSELTPSYMDPSPYVERWVGFSVYLPSASYGTDQAPDIVQQIHADNGESPPFAIQTQSGKWQVGYNWDQGGSVKYHTIDLGIPYEKDQWVDFVYHIKFSKGSDGFIELWKNGTKIWSYSGQTQYTNVKNGNFYRIGIYKWAWSQGISSSQTQRIAYYDDWRVGDANASYNDVAPGSH